MRIALGIACLASLALASPVSAGDSPEPTRAMPDALRLLMLDETPTFGTRLPPAMIAALAPRWASRELARIVRAPAAPVANFDLRLHALPTPMPIDVRGFEQLEAPAHARVPTIQPVSLSAEAPLRLEAEAGQGDQPLLYYRFDVRTEMAGILGPTPRRRHALDTMLTLRVTGDSEAPVFGIHGGAAAVAWGMMTRE